MSKQQRAVKISVLSRATSEAVYDVLADLRSHLVWTGSRQTSMYHLEALEAPAGPAQVGTVFSSTGTIPMSVRRWHDRSVVKVADRPRTFEYLTEASTGPKGMAARYSHRYELVPTGGSDFHGRGEHGADLGGVFVPPETIASLETHQARR